MDLLMYHNLGKLLESVVARKRNMFVALKTGLRFLKAKIKLLLVN